MKIIEAMKQTKYLRQKVDDLLGKIAGHCSDYEHMTAIYDNQKDQVSSWVQMAEDTVKEILRLRVAIQRTNIATEVSIQIGDKSVTKNIAEWIHRRRDLAKLNLDIWAALRSDEKHKFMAYKDASGEDQVSNLRLYYDPKQRDEKKDIFKQEPSLIDGALEVKNAVTDLIEK